MSTATLPTAPTWTDDEALFEIIDGVRVELPMSAENIFLANELSYQVSAFTRPRNLGRTVVEALFELPLPDRSRNRRPDMAFVSFERWPLARSLPTEGNTWAVVPDLAVEFVTPSEGADELIEKVRDYLDAGVKCVWIAYTRQRYLLEFESLTRVRGLTETDELDGKDILPGFRVSVASLFQPRA
ncbi:MAG TPA: Uma2 family endonuclease [Gemmataceae bacterium]|nr:Uma2 family endonuclease [Gemmataceae bacterium]